LPVFQLDDRGKEPFKAAFGPVPFLPRSSFAGSDLFRFEHLSGIEQRLPGIEAGNGTPLAAD
jgi:hypothetical protein